MGGGGYGHGAEFSVLSEVGCRRGIELPSKACFM